MLSTFKRFFVGQPIPTSEESHQRIGKIVALAVFASDAISSTAYATEEILLVLVPLGGVAASIEYLIPLSVIVMGLLTLVVLSYRQTIFAFPTAAAPTWCPGRTWERPRRSWPAHRFWWTTS